MKKRFWTLVVTASVAAITVAAPSQATAQAAGPGEGSGEITLSSGTTIDASLSRTLDAKRAKPGDPVEARFVQDMKQDGAVVLRRGTRLFGRVTRVQQRTKEQPQSELGITFDRAVPNKGPELPLNASIRALAAAQSSAPVAMSDAMTPSGGAASSMSTVASAGGPLGDVPAQGTTAGATMNPAASSGGNTDAALSPVAASAGSTGGLVTGGRLSPDSRGVFGLQELSIDWALSNGDEGVVIVSSTRNVRLGGGTQILLRIN